MKKRRGGTSRKCLTTSCKGEANSGTDGGKVNRREKVVRGKKQKNSRAELLGEGEQKDSAINECSEDRGWHKVGKKRIK